MHNVPVYRTCSTWPVCISLLTGSFCWVYLFIYLFFFYLGGGGGVKSLVLHFGSYNIDGSGAWSHNTLLFSHLLGLANLIGHFCRVSSASIWSRPLSLASRILMTILSLSHFFLQTTVLTEAWRLQQTHPLLGICCWILPFHNLYSFFLAKWVVNLSNTVLYLFWLATNRLKLWNVASASSSMQHMNVSTSSLIP